MIHPEPSENETNICHCCGYAAPLQEYPRCLPPMGGDLFKFCDICAGTFLSHCVTYAELYGKHHHLWASIGWIANLLRDEIRATRATRAE